MDINLLSCDAFVVDEVHNFNRAFNKVKKGSRVYGQIRNSKGKLKANIDEGGKVQANIKGALRYPENVYSYDTKANYNVRGEVQNFIAICLYFQERGRKISKGQKRNIENTIFLSATPFTDDNFQMLSLFGALSTSKLMQGNVFNTFDFFQVYAKELWQKDIDYQNRYTLFPKIIGYKNNYALSQLIKTFTNFKISDAEIEAQRPQKVIIGTEAPRIEGAEEDESLQNYKESNRQIAARGRGAAFDCFRSNVFNFNGKPNIKKLTPPPTSNRLTNSSSVLLDSCALLIDESSYIFWL